MRRENFSWKGRRKVARMGNEMDEKTKKEMERMLLISKAIRFNHDEGRRINAIVNVDEEIKNYQTRITKLSLPYRFGMYKPQTRNLQVQKEEELEIPDVEPQEIPAHPDHKVRKIFN